jgi:hypothetical protein
MKKHNKYAIIGLKALQRAAKKVADEARKGNYKIPIWNNSRIEYKIAGIVSERTRIDCVSEANHNLIRCWTSPDCVFSGGFI